MRSDNHEQYWAIVPAAGLGLRMGASVPKQYLKLHDKMIIEYAIDALTACSEITKIVVVLNADDHYWQYVKLQNPDQVVATRGGEIRAQSVFNGLIALQKLASFNDWVMVHDAVRPCLDVQDVKRLIRKLRDHPVGGILGFPVSDTLKRIDEDSQIDATLHREKIWHALTPQMFRYHVLYDALLKEVQVKNNVVTDESSAVESLGFKPLMIHGNPHNIKITIPADLVLAEQLLMRLSIL